MNAALVRFDAKADYVNYIIHKNIRNIADLHRFTNKELDKIITLFHYPHDSFWKKIGAFTPLLRHQSVWSTLQRRIYLMFSIPSDPMVDIVQFILSVAILCDKSTRVTRASLLCNILFQTKDIIDINDIETLFGDLPTREDVLFRVSLVQKLTDITPRLFLLGWRRLLDELGGVVSRDVLEHTLETHLSSVILLFPLSMRI